MSDHSSHIHSAIQSSSPSHLLEGAPYSAPTSHLPPAEGRREVVLKDIVVKTSPTEGKDLEQLTLTIFWRSKEETKFLQKISPQTWKYGGTIDLPSDIDELSFVARSEDGGDLGYVTVRKDELSALMVTGSDTDLERRLVAEESRPELEITFAIAVSYLATPYLTLPSNTEQSPKQLDTPYTSGNGSSPPDIVVGSTEPPTGSTVTGCVNTLPLPRGLPRIFALVIGINEYLSLDKLGGAVNDANAVKGFLTRDLNVPEDRICLLLDDQASHGRIVSEMKELSDRHEIQRGDPILIYFAGHGVQLSAPPTWDAGGPGRKIQGIAPCDYQKDRVHAIPDRKIGSILNQIREKKGDNITVIFDCCFSASGTRTDIPTKGVRTTDIRGVVLDDELSTELDQASLRGLTSENPVGFGRRGLVSHILLAACNETELARESNQRGRFTTALLKLLQRDQMLETLTYTDILKQIERIPGQNPQVEGIHSNRFIFNAKPVRPQFPNVKFEEGIYVMDAGKLQGITQYSQFTVYANYESFLDSTPWGILVVSEVEPFTSRMRRCEGEVGDVLAKGIAVLSTGGAEQTLSIEVSNDLPASFHESLEELKLQRVVSIQGAYKPDVQIEDGSDAQLQLQLEDDHVVFNILDRVVSDYGLKNLRHGLPRTSPKRNIIGVLSGGCHFYWHLRRGHYHPIAEAVKVEFSELTLSSDEMDGARYLVPTEKNMLRNGAIELLVHDKPTMYGIKLTNDSNWDLFPFAFYFDHSDWSIETYYHPPTAGNFKLEPPLRKRGGTLTIGYGSGGGDPISFRLGDNQDLDVGHLKIFLSTKPAQMRNVEQVTPFKNGQRAGRQRPAVFDTWLALQYPIVQRRA